jgi:acyl-CoA hydrolase
VRIVSQSRLGAVLGALPGVPRVVAGGNFATPWQALAVLDAAVPEYRLCMLNAQPGVPDRDGVVLESPFIGPGIRGSARLKYFPGRLSLVPVMLATTMPPDVVLVQTSPPADATVSLGTEVNVLPAAIEAARARGGLVIAQVNRHVPFTYGDAVLSVGDIDYGIEADVPLPSPPIRPPHQASAAIGERIARRPRMTSVNSALQVDLFAQANASRVRGAIYSGFGGQTDFVVGALHSHDGSAIIALPSWHPKADVSTVVPRLAGPVTSFQHSFIVSDQGTAAVWGHDAVAQAEAIITRVAHPSARDELRAAGRELGFRLDSSAERAEGPATSGT